MVFQTMIFRPLSREPTHTHHKQQVNNTFVVKSHLAGSTLRYADRIITSVPRATSDGMAII